MDLNNGMFLKNGGCGYILKPSIMRDPYAYFSPKPSESTTSGEDWASSPQTLNIKVMTRPYLTYIEH